MELTRVTLVDYYGDLILDELVKPKHEVLDLNTRWSGVTEEGIKGARVGLEEVRELVGRYCGTGTVLVGHGLENDFNALRVSFLGEGVILWESVALEEEVGGCDTIS